MEEVGISIEIGEKELLRLESEGKTPPMLIAINNKLAGIIAVADKIKENSQKAIEDLKAMDLEVYMITGDNERTAKAIAKEVGIDNVLAEVLPENKAEMVEKK